MCITSESNGIRFGSVSEFDGDGELDGVSALKTKEMGLG